MSYYAPIFRQCFSFLIIVLCCAVHMVKADVCEDLAKDVSRIKLSLESLEQTKASFERLLAANLSYEEDELSLFPFELDQHDAVAAELDLINRKQKELNEEISIPNDWASCGDQTEAWLELSNEYRRQMLSLMSAQSALLVLPGNERALLQGNLASWFELVKVYHSISHTFSSDTVLTDHPIFIAIQTYKVELEHWIELLLKKEREASVINVSWLDLMGNAALENSVKQPEIADIYNHATQTLRLTMTEWRNKVMLDAGWFEFIKQTLSPSDFVDGLAYELQISPKNFVNNLSYPFIREYLSSEKESKGVQLLTNWTIQFSVLLLLIFVLIKFAANSASWLSDIQQMLLKKFESSSGHSLLSGVFWVLKPNVSWVFILVFGNLISVLLPDDWRIIQLISPLATIYAGFRALRIIIEWGLSRTYTRSGMFLSNHTAELLISDSSKMTWAVVYATGLWGIVYVMGGAYLTYLLSVVYIGLLWCGAWWVLAKHDIAVNKLIHHVLDIKTTVGKKTDQNRLFTWINRIAWPLVFVFVHVLDVISSLNQKLMVFDVYRSFSVKLLRVRLESKSEDVTEEDEGEPDQNYSDWMLREVPDSLLFDVGDFTSLLDPLNNWFNNKTDENVMVILGESGSGKSTLVRRLPELWEALPIKVLDVPAKVTDPQVFFDSIAEVLGVEPFNDLGGLVRQDETIERQVIVIDSAHNLFLAEVGNFNAYKALLECMNAHLENVFWVVVMHAPSWAYLNYVFVREQRVSNIYKMPRWSPMDIRKLILSRHQGGRRRLKYNEMLLSAAASSESSSVRAADSRVFNILWEQCGGNPLAAIELWINAVKVKGRIAEVGVPQRPSANLLNGLKDDLYFIYTAIVSHSALSTAEIMQVTHFSEPVVRHALKQGINLGMITRDNTKRYMVDPYWYGTLSGFLHRKNMLWG